jgi:hypothetical protein
MMGLVAQIHREENQKKGSKKAPPLLVMTGSEDLPPSCTRKHPQKKKQKKGESSLLTMAVTKASPPNYAHKYEKVKKGKSNLPVLLKTSW